MDKLIAELRDLAETAEGGGFIADASETVPHKAARLLEECRALLERLAAGEPAPEGHTFQSWAGDLLK